MTTFATDTLPAAVLWDMDGTLVDTEPYWIEAEYALAHLETDVAWIAALLDDLRSGALTWDRADLTDIARRADAGGEDTP